MLYVILATLFWGFMGISSRWLSQFGLSYANISFVRCILAASSFSIYSFLKNRQAFRVDFISLAVIFVFGIFSIALGFIFYSASVERIPIAIATVLMFKCCQEIIPNNMKSRLYFEKWRNKLQSDFVVFIRKQPLSPYTSVLATKKR